ncbi:MAG: 2-oxoisovalerate dehydrogenase [Methylococcales bacterium]
MNEIIFLVEDAPEDGFTARALEASIYTDAANISDLHQKVREAVDCHFEPTDKPKMIRLHFVREEIIAA